MNNEEYDYSLQLTHFTPDLWSVQECSRAYHKAHPRELVTVLHLINSNRKPLQDPSAEQCIHRYTQNFTWWNSLTSSWWLQISLYTALHSEEWFHSCSTKGCLTCVGQYNHTCFESTSLRIYIASSLLLNLNVRLYCTLYCTHFIIASSQPTVKMPHRGT